MLLVWQNLRRVWRCHLWTKSIILNLATTQIVYKVCNLQKETMIGVIKIRYYLTIPPLSQLSSRCHHDLHLPLPNLFHHNEKLINWKILIYTILSPSNVWMCVAFNTFFVVASRLHSKLMDEAVTLGAAVCHSHRLYYIKEHEQ